MNQIPRGLRTTLRKPAILRRCCGMRRPQPDEAVATGAHREAASQYERALRHADGLAAAEHADMLSAFALESRVIGRYEVAIEAFTKAINIRRQLGDKLGEGAHLSRLAQPYINLGRNSDAEEASRAAIAVLETIEPSIELASAYSHQAYMRMLGRDNYEAVEWGKERSRSPNDSTTRTHSRRDSISSGRPT